MGGEQKRNEGQQLLIYSADTHQGVLLEGRTVSVRIFAAMAHPFIHATHDTQLSCRGHRSQLSLSSHSHQLEKYAKVHWGWLFFFFLVFRAVKGPILDLEARSLVPCPWGEGLQTERSRQLISKQNEKKKKIDNFCARAKETLSRTSWEDTIILERTGNLYSLL